MTQLTFTLTFPLNAAEQIVVERILHIIITNKQDAFANIDATSPSTSDPTEQTQPKDEWSGSIDARAQEFASLLTLKTAKVVQFVVNKMGRVNNDELAEHLGFGEHTAYTSSLLGKVTWALRTIGVRADGRSGVNWYQKRKMNRRTILLVRPEVLELFRASLAFIQE